MSRILGTVVRGLRGPIIEQGNDIAKIATETLMNAIDEAGIVVQNADVLAITESVVARSQGNYASVDAIAKDLNAKFEGRTLGLVFPILSRNRFAIILRAIARAKDKLVIMLSYPSDEVGNHLLDQHKLLDAGINPYTETLSEAEFEKNFGRPIHTFTGVDYVKYYASICAEENCEVEMIFSNNPKEILKYTDEVLACDIHTRTHTLRILNDAGVKKALGLDEILTSSVDNSGYNAKYGLLGSNKATEELIKLFPHDCTELTKSIQKTILEKTGKKIEVMVYGDGAFKDPVGKIWELADPVVSPGYTDGLEGTPHELKLKYLADNDFGNLNAEAKKAAILKAIEEKSNEQTAGMAGQGTTPRRLTDLLGSLCDLTSGSGDKGTPFIYIQGYFDNYADA